MLTEQEARVSIGKNVTFTEPDGKIKHGVLIGFRYDVAYCDFKDGRHSYTTVSRQSLKLDQLK